MARVPYNELKNPTPPRWTCFPCEDMSQARETPWCGSHDKALTETALDGSSLLCPVGAESDPYEFIALVCRDVDKRLGIKPTVPLFWKEDEEPRSARSNLLSEFAGSLVEITDEYGSKIGEGRLDSDGVVHAVINDAEYTQRISHLTTDDS